MGRSSWRSWALVAGFFVVLVVLSWQLFDRPIGQTVVSAVIGMVVGIIVVRLRGRGGARR